MSEPQAALAATPAGDDLATQYTNVCAEIAICEDGRAAIDVRIGAITADQQALEDTYTQQRKALSDERLKLRQDREAASRRIDALKKTRDALAVERQVQDHLAAAAASRVEAEKQVASLGEKLASLDEKHKEADELLAKLRAQAATEPNAPEQAG